MMMTAELTNNGQSIYVKTNDLSDSNSPYFMSSFDWKEAYVPLVDIGRIELQTNNQGLMVYLKSGMIYQFHIMMVSMLNGKDTVTESGGAAPIQTHEALFEELAIMLGYKTA